MPHHLKEQNKSSQPRHPECRHGRTSIGPCSLGSQLQVRHFIGHAADGLQTILAEYFVLSARSAVYSCAGSTRRGYVLRILLCRVRGSAAVCASCRALLPSLPKYRHPSPSGLTMRTGSEAPAATRDLYCTAGLDRTQSPPTVIRDGRALEVMQRGLPAGPRRFTLRSAPMQVQKLKLDTESAMLEMDQVPLQILDRSVHRPCSRYVR